MPLKMDRDQIFYFRNIDTDVEGVLEWGDVDRGSSSSKPGRWFLH